MVQKIAELARALGILLAIVAAFVSLSSFNIQLVILALGLIAGLGYNDETATRLILTILVLPVVGVALGIIPTVGTYLSAIANNVAIAASGAAATMLAIRFFHLVVDGLVGVAAKK